MIDPVLAQAILAVDKLNSWVRSASYRDHHTSAKGAVYWLKRCAIRAANANKLLASFRKIVVRVSCNRCSGTGRYQDWDGYDRGLCRSCTGTGTATLEFVETTIKAFSHSVSWHTPLDKFYFLDIELSKESIEVKDWKPETKGIDRTPAEVAECLNVAESVFTERPGWRYLRDGVCQYNDFNYQLYIGSTDENRCSFCSKPAINLHYGCLKGRVSWLDHACQRCNDLYKAAGKSIHERFPFPTQLTQEQSIQQWIERNNGLQEPERPSYY